LSKRAGSASIAPAFRLRNLHEFVWHDACLDLSLSYIERMQVEVPYEIASAEARRRMKALTDYWVKKYGVEARWTKGVAALSGTVLGVTFEATLRVGEKAAVIDAPDPGILFRQQVVGYLTRKLESYLADPITASIDKRPAA
jgi:hypothetical protein